MTPGQITLIQKSWEKVLPISEIAAGMFYGKLFELDVELKSLFKGNMKEQGAKLMNMLNTVVNSLGKLDIIVPAVQNLGASHVKYGVKDQHYDTVAAALLWTLAEGLGEDFTDEVKDAWTTAYMLLATTMKESAKDAA